MNIPIVELLDKLIASSEIVYPEVRLSIVPKDQSDSRILETALEARVDFVITGDNHLLQLESFRSITILSPAEFLKNYAIK